MYYHLKSGPVFRWIRYSGVRYSDGYCSLLFKCLVFKWHLTTVCPSSWCRPLHILSSLMSFLSFLFSDNHSPRWCQCLGTPSQSSALSLFLSFESTVQCSFFSLRRKLSNEENVDLTFCRCRFTLSKLCRVGWTKKNSCRQ